MPVNYEVKSQLAKLLATEDLIVEHKSVSTAQFNVETRVLTLPMWKRASDVVYDMLVGHEVGHALFTSNDWSWEKEVPQQFVNVTEDVRIEKLMKRKYPGLHKTFYAGYKELSDDDFFCIEDQNVSDMNLADRANLYYKIGRFIDIPFHNLEEERIIKLLGDSETFEDAVEAAKQLYAYCKDQQQQQSAPMTMPPQPNGQAGAEDMEQQQQQQNAPESFGSGDRPDLGPDESNYEDQIEEEVKEMNQEQVEPGKPGTEPEVQTDSTFTERIEEFNGNLTGQENGYFELPEMNVKNFIIPFSEIQKGLSVGEMIEKEHNPDCFAWADSNYRDFKKSAQKEVNYLVKEFECKKSADAYARASTARTGVLDCSKLHTYKYNEDLFRKVTTIPDGKNHGLVFILDWSGSMGNCIVETIKQLYNLVWFCSKCNIPFDVYAFTNSYGDGCSREDTIWEEGKFIIQGDFRLMNLLSSTAKKKDLEKQMLHVFRLVFGMRNYVGYKNPPQFTLSGTPLNEALACLHYLIPQFKKDNDLQKVHCFVLTDGEASGLHVARENSFGGQGSMGCGGGHGYLRNRKSGHVYQIGYNYSDFTYVMLRDLRDSLKDVNFIGIRLCGPREINNFVREYEFVSNEVIKQIKKDKFYDIKKSGYTSYFAMMTSALSNESEFDVEEGASKAKIKSAFVKNLKTKALNKKVLSKFMELVA